MRMLETRSYSSGSYSSGSPGTRAFIREILSLYRGYAKGIAERVRASIEDVQRVETCVRERFGMELTSKCILEVGPGQFLGQMTYLAQRNHVIGVDRDLIVHRGSPLDYIKMLKYNGARRTVKTIARKLLRVDAKYAAELRKCPNLERASKLTVFKMDVRDLKFPRNSFDFVYSRSVLHSLPNPDVALDQIVRVVRPGGVVYILIHLYSSPTGSLDPRVYTDRRNELNAWPHLRPKLLHTVAAPNVYLNKLRLSQWLTLFAERMPGVECTLRRGDDSTLESVARILQSEGELAEYSLDELLTFEIVALWRKPPMPAAIDPADAVVAAGM